MKILPQDISVGDYVFWQTTYKYIIVRIISKTLYINNSCNCLKTLILETNHTQYNVNEAQLFAIENSSNYFYTKRSDIDKLLIFSNE